ncbi:hypothetical protein [Acuticoccus kandeliae]|uniref:hypothetical protein n=1 Tax=Acuticoccus kandeliae TaxID=2073160 RepID=UPI000D3ED131|nr:hypothetical protein [Acuticoccus kandeliae]
MSAPSDARAAGFDALVRLIARSGGVQYSTVLAFEADGGGLAGRRVFTTVPDIYPTGRSKPLPASEWLDHVHHRAALFVADGEAAIRAAYPDPETVFGLGAVRLANKPVMVGGQCVALLNVAQGPGHDWDALAATLDDAAAVVAALLAQ